MVVADGRTVTLHYRIAFADGTVADSTFDSDPETITIGDGTLLPALEHLLLGLLPGDSRSYTLPPDSAFGYPDTDNIHTIPATELSGKNSLEPGMVVGFTTPEGEEIPGIVIEKKGGELVVDFNHPFAGHTLSIDVTIVAVS